MKRIAVLTLVFFLGIAASLWAEPEISPSEAYKMLQADMAETFLIDVRSMAEYELVGHPPMAYNIPYKLWSPQGMKVNPDFLQDVAKKFKKTDKLLLICRTHQRSRLAQRVLINAGFEHVFVILNGFEGDKIMDIGSPEYGHQRKINGWQHDGLPYTYKLDRRYVYKLHSSCGCN